VALRPRGGTRVLGSRGGVLPGVRHGPGRLRGPYARRARPAARHGRVAAQAAEAAAGGTARGAERSTVQVAPLGRDPRVPARVRVRVQDRRAREPARHQRVRLHVQALQRVQRSLLRGFHPGGVHHGRAPRPVLVRGGRRPLHMGASAGPWESAGRPAAPVRLYLRGDGSVTTDWSEARRARREVKRRTGRAA
jgi:hypothetical protein